MALQGGTERMDSLTYQSMLGGSSFFLTPCSIPQIILFDYFLLGILFQVGFTYEIHNILI